MAQKKMHPAKTFLALLATMLALFGIMAAFPVDGIEIGSIKFQFPNAEEFFEDIDPMKTESERELTHLLEDTTIILTTADSLKMHQKLDSIKEAKKKLQFVDASNPSLSKFFEVLQMARQRKVRVMHFGDSQIEGDRITGYLRNKLQTEFTGFGGGLFPIVPVAPQLFVNINYSENWKRYSGFGKKDSTVKHMKYGALMSFSRFAPIEPSDTAEYEGWVTIRKPHKSYGRTKTYHQLKVYYGNVKGTVTYQVWVDGDLRISDTLLTGALLGDIFLEMENTPEEIKIEFKGNDSPDIYGISLEGNTGVVMDNIPLRGSSGTIFKRQDRALLQSMFTELKPSLILLEFGGNTVPYINGQEECLNYGNWFKAQIKLLKRMNPEAAIILIGPSDMASKIKTEYRTRTYLPYVRDVLKQAAMESNCVFWDMYEAMGGLNSMIKWVKAEPPLAAKDYTHFTPKGAKKIASLFYQQLMEKHEDYNMNKTNTVVHNTIKK